ncbi:MAG: YitT family protein [Dysgonamonadaceae bacterium]
MELQKQVTFKKFYWKDYLTILLGTFTYSLGVTQFIIPHEFVLGGLTGIGVLLNYAFDIPVSLSVLALNSVLLLLSFRILGGDFLIKTVVGVVSLSGFLAMFESFNWTPIMMEESLMAGLIGSLIGGTGIGMVMSVNGSTGGTDIIVLIINKFRNVTPGRTMLIVDLIIVASSYIIFRSVETIVLGIIIIAVMSTCVDWVLNGIRQSVQFLIVSKHHEEIASQIGIQLHRGCTVLDGTGFYTKQPQKVLMIMAKKSESNTIFRIVKSIDEQAFISQGSVIGVYGLGFDRIK